MKRFYRFLMVLLFAATPLSLSAQLLDKANSDPINFSNFVTNCFINYYTTGGVQEKLYLVTDKPFYSAGDTIYFSAFLVNSIYFNRTTDTKFIYVELIDATGNVAERMRVMGSGGRFHNAIILSPKITSGKYTLRAYTKWQTNFDNELLFSRQLEIGNYIDDAILTNIKYEFNGEDKVLAIVEVTNNSSAPVSDNTVEYSLSINGRTTRHMTKTDKDGFFRRHPVFLHQKAHPIRRRLQGDILFGTQNGGKGVLREKFRNGTLCRPVRLVGVDRTHDPPLPQPLQKRQNPVVNGDLP